MPKIEIDRIEREVIRIVPQFAETMRKFPGIQEIHSNIVLSEIKYTTRLPI